MPDSIENYSNPVYNLTMELQDAAPHPYSKVDEYCERARTEDVGKQIIFENSESEFSETGLGLKHGEKIGDQGFLNKQENPEPISRNTHSAQHNSRQDMFQIDNERRRHTDDKAHLNLTGSKRSHELSTKNLRPGPDINEPSQTSKSANTHLEGGDGQSSMENNGQIKSDTFILHQGLINHTI